MLFAVECQGATSAPVFTTDLATDCSTAGGTLVFSEPVSGLPELTLADGEAIAGAMIALWAVAWCIRAIKKHLEDL